MKKFMKKIEVNEKISVWGMIDNKNIQIKNQKLCNILKGFNQILQREKIDINKAKVINTTKLMIQDKEVDLDKIFSMYAYIRRKGKADKTSMRYYFNIEFMKVSDLLLEIQSLSKNFLKYNELDKKFDLILEYFYIEGENENE